MTQLPAKLQDTGAPAELTEEEISSLWHGLSDLQQAWFLEYMGNGFNATQAAKDAGYQAKSDEVFRRIGSDNRHHPKLLKLRRAMMQRHMGADEAFARLAQIARSDMQDFLDVQEDGTAVPNFQKAKERGALHLLKEVKIEQTEDPETGEVTTKVKFKLYDKQKAQKQILDLLGAGDGEGEGDTVYQFNQQINNYLEGEGDTPFDDVDNSL